MRSFFAVSYPETSDRASSTPEPAACINAMILAAGVAQRQAVPEGATHVLLSANAEIFVRFGDADVTAAVPGAAVTDGSASELNTAGRALPKDVTHVSIVSPAGGTVTLAYYGNPTA